MCPEFWSCWVTVSSLMDYSTALRICSWNTRMLGDMRNRIGLFGEKSCSCYTEDHISDSLADSDGWSSWLSVQPAGAKHFRRKCPADNPKWCSGNLNGLWGSCRKVSVFQLLPLLCVLLCLGHPLIFKSVEILPTPTADIVMHRIQSNPGIFSLQPSHHRRLTKANTGALACLWPL